MQVILHVWIKILPVFVCADAGSFNIEKHTIWNLTKGPILIFLLPYEWTTIACFYEIWCKNRKEVRISNIHHASRETDDQERFYSPEHLKISIKYYVTAI